MTFAISAIDVLELLLAHLPDVRDRASLLLSAGRSTPGVGVLWRSVCERAMVQFGGRPTDILTDRPHARQPAQPEPARAPENACDFSTLRRLLADSITPEELASTTWYHVWSQIDGPLLEIAQTPRYVMYCATNLDAELLGKDRKGISNEIRLRRVTFGAGGTMSWSEPPADSEVSRDDLSEDGEWTFVQRIGTWNGAVVTAPGTVLQFRHSLPGATWDRLRDRLKGRRANYVFPALRVYRVPRGWCLYSGHDTFTSWEPDTTNIRDVECPKHWPPKFRWSVDRMRAQMAADPERAKDMLEYHGDQDWLEAEGKAFQRDVREGVQLHPGQVAAAVRHRAEQS